MAWPQVKSAGSVRTAVQEFETLGADEFFARYGFGAAKRYHLVVDGRRYPSKAITARAAQIETGLPVPNEFSGGWYIAKRLRLLGFEVVEDGPLPEDALAVRLVPLEAGELDDYEIKPRPEPIAATRHEKALVDRFVAHLGTTMLKRHQIPLPSGEMLWTDLYDVDTRTLYEAKSSADRGTVRLALGQILDYRYCLMTHDEPPLEYRILLPSEPVAGIPELLSEYGVGVAWPTTDGWENRGA